ncbi:flagellar biosynthetic protein FlhB [Deferribacter desulfuricans SSM1]|uniref:Flagellar biosynthetic protein FlhB n=1 Tax=Deferribacter desulfuricans (strain DSM 14783 / JCM 11476 / NBRC 101012 / SSM1) TaxID=639282 RepID=D3PBD4_DEFDS|nr:flagellar biosynthesis protein FlhB [Deferribacter desulfuricans]BAI79907.1 flagellar biosynthetic protein FlhB [Deferribacter desulfuricans SSM1]
MPEKNDAERTEEATPRRRQKAREEGNVPKSRELSTAIIFLISVIFLYFYTPILIDNFSKLISHTLSKVGYTLSKSATVELFNFVFQFYLKVLFPLFALLVVAGLLVNVAQFGFLISPKALEPKWDRLNPINGLQNLFSKRSLVELIKSIFKIFVVGFVAYIIVRGKIGVILNLADADPFSSMVFFGKLVFELCFKIGLLILLMSILDFFYQKWQYEQDLKMTKQEVKEEFKQMEGDPLIRQRIRSMQREMARKRMMEEVPKADVVITNPTHYAVAIKYDINKDRAPVVVAKGQRLMAQKIKEIAKENGVFIHEDPPLARTLYSQVEIGDEIPENLYKAIAEILAIVYKMKNKRVEDVAQ